MEERQAEDGSGTTASLGALQTGIFRRVSSSLYFKDSGFPGCHIYQYSNIKARIPVFCRSIVIILG